MVRCANERTLRSTFFFIQFINGLVERYPEVFDGDGSPSQHQANFAKKWGSYATIVELAGGDITRFNIITREPLEKCLMYLAYRSDKNLIEQLIHKESLAKISQR